MTKQPDPSRSVPRHGSVVPSPLADDPSELPAPILPKLKTLKPRMRREAPAQESDPFLIRRKPDARSTNPFASLGRTPVPVDLESLEGLIQPAGESEPISIRERLERNRHPFSSLLFSTIAHLAILLTLSFFAFGWDQPERSIGIIATIDSTPVPDEPSSETNAVEIIAPDENTSPIEMAFNDTALEESAELAESAEVIPNPVTKDSNPNPSEHETRPSPNATLPTGGGLEGREQSARGQLAAARGGTRESEMAVELGLKWMVAHQQKDGSWHFKHDDGNCEGACGNEGLQESTTAATGLALMSFLGAGYTHRAGPYRDQVQKGLDYLIYKMRITQHGGNLCQGEPGMYSHAIATIALSEALAMTNDANLTQAVEQARKYIETAQHKAGGWRYNPGSKGDMTVTGWQLMALKSCQLAGAKTGDITLQLAEDFIDSLQSSSGCYGYQSPAENPVTTAVGILSKMYLGAELENVSLQQGTDFVADQSPSKNDVYFNYYATQVLHHRHEKAWPKWNKQMRDYLVATQDQSDTHRAGSWYFPDKHGQVGGRLYTTAMSVMILEVYYRYMPLYDKDAVK